MRIRLFAFSDYSTQLAAIRHKLEELTQLYSVHSADIGPMSAHLLAYSHFSVRWKMIGLMTLL